MHLRTALVLNHTLVEAIQVIKYYFFNNVLHLRTELVLNHTLVEAIQVIAHFFKTKSGT